MPVARATSAIPPWPTASASAAAHSRRVRSFSTGASASYFVRTVPTSIHSVSVISRYALEALDYLIQRGSTDELRWPITLLLQEIDHPRVLMFIVQELASTSRHYHDAGLPPPFVDHVRDYWRRLQEEDGRGMSIESRRQLLGLWQCRTNDRHLRRQAFALWEATRLPDDIVVLRDLPPDDELADRVLHARIARQDRAAIPGVLERQDADSHGRWLWSARHIWSPEMTDALDALLSRRAIDSVRRWGESIESDRSSCDLLIRLPEAQAEKLMMEHWEHLRYAPALCRLPFTSRRHLS